MTVPYAFGSATTSIPLSQLDANFDTPITLGNTAIQLGNTVTTLNNMTLANATVSSGNVTVTSASLSGNLTFTGTGNRITGDFSNSTQLNRVAFQTSTTNGNTAIHSLPNGTATTAGYSAFNNSDPTNAGYGQLRTTSSAAELISGITGTGTYLPMTFYTGGSERMRIDTSGYVGIGTSSPLTGGLTIDSAGVAGGSANLYFKSQGADADEGVWRQRVFNSGGSGFFEVAGINDAVSAGAIAWRAIKSSGNVIDRHEWYTNGSERMRIDSSGNLLVGTTSNNGRITSFIDSAAGRAGFFMVNAASSLGSDAVGISKFDNDTTTSQVFVKFFINNNAAASGLITANGANQATFTSSSDARLKENIVELPPQLANIMALRPVEFDYIESEGGGHQIGFVAQEVQNVYPDLVGKRSDEMLLVSDLNKNDARLIKAIQELNAKVETLQAEVAALKGLKK